MEKFRKLGINEHILKGIQDQRIDTPTGIQEKTIPLVLAGKDVIAASSTGSGKTLAFGAGIIQNCQRKKMVQALILTPTRELAEQVADSIRKFAKHNPLEIAAVYGGVSINPQIDKLRTADVVIATPGRLLDHLERRTIRLDAVKILVLDEADRMLDMGFQRDVERIINACPKNRQTLLFSATIDQEIARLSRRYMKDPVKIEAENMVDPKKLKQAYYDVGDKQKFQLLVQLLKQEKGGLVMVFCNTRMITDFVANNLEANKIDSVAIHGGLSQDKRMNIMKNFNRQTVYVLVCTDVAARGLDIKGVSHVYNYDIPKDAKEYIHRIGRTARAGSEGIAISIVSPMDHDNFTRVLRNRELRIDHLEAPQIEKAIISWTPKRRGSYSDNGPRRFGGRENRGGFGRREGGEGRGGGFGRSSEGEGRSGGFGERKRFGQRPSSSGGSRGNFRRR